MVTPNSVPTAGSPLADWLDYQLRLHPQTIEFGLERVGEVWRRMGAPTPAKTVITVGGTNGKGSTVTFLEAMLRAQGLRVGAYTSPHLQHYGERVRIDGWEATDLALVEAFARVEAARRAPAAVPLTFFEFGTLAALAIFADAELDIALLEVGLGGRLDAVNLIDADAAIVTTVDLDHQQWLGDSRDAIGREKAGIFRPGRPAIVGDAEAPRGLIDAARHSGAELLLAGRDYAFDSLRGGSWCWSAASKRVELPLPAIAGSRQLANAAAAIAALHALRERLGWHPAALGEGLRAARIDARLQRLGGAPECVIDVAHNPQAARVLAEWLSANPPKGRTLAVFGALGDKDAAGVLRELREVVDAWFLAGLEHASPRGISAASLRVRVADVLPAERGVRLAASVEEAFETACLAAAAGDRVVAFGSFFVAGPALRLARARACRAPQRELRADGVD